MTWVLYRREHDGNHDYKEWSDEQVKEIAKEVARNYAEETGEIVKDLLPEPIRRVIEHPYKSTVDAL